MSKMSDMAATIEELRTAAAAINDAANWLAEMFSGAGDGADESDDWTDPETWKKANPSLGITVGIDKVRDACESAKQNPGEENAFRQLRLNQWVKQAVRWMPMDRWDKCAFATSEDDLEGRVCYGGLDLSSTTDITALVLVFPPEYEDDKYIILPYFWIPEDNLDLREIGRASCRERVYVLV